MSKVPAKASFVQPKHGMGKTSTAKNKSNVPFAQNPKNGTGKTTSKKNPGKLGFTQKSAAMKGNSTKKNAGKVGFDQPNPAKKTTKMPAASSTSSVMPKAGKYKAPKQVSVPAGGFKAVSQLVAARKKVYGA